MYYEDVSFSFENQNFTNSIKKGMPNLNDIKNLLQNNKITEFVKLNKLSSRDIIDFTNRYTNWAGKLFQHIDVKHAARVFKFLRRKKQEIIIKSLPDEKALENSGSRNEGRNLETAGLSGRFCRSFNDPGLSSDKRIRFGTSGS